MKNKVFYMLILFGSISFGANACAADSLSYQYKTLKKESKALITTDKDTIVSTIILKYPVFKNPVWNEQVTQLILNSETEKSNYATYDEYLNAFINASLEANAEEEEYKRSWSQDITVRVEPQFTGTQTLSLSFFSDSYTGGVHPNTSLIYVNYDIFSRKIIKLSDLINPIMMARLTYTASTIFRKQEGLSPTESLENFFFENQKFSLNTNFLITKKGLLFYYNPYEIRSYAEGPMELLVPYSAISTLLKINPYIPQNRK
jgi:hypothetical protein